MHTTNLYQIYDVAAECVGGPIIAAPKDSIPVRDFLRLLQDKNTDPGKYPEQYNLLRIGTQDLTTGQIAADKPVVIYEGAQFLAAVMAQAQENK